MTISSQSVSRGARGPFRRAALALGLLLVLASACGGSEEPAPSPAAESPVGKAPAQAPVPGDAAVGQTGEGGLPEGFPDDLPLYPDARPTRWMSGGGPGSLVAFDAHDDPQDVYDFFAAELPGAGWEIEDQSNAANNWMLVATKSGLTARISIASSADGGSQFGVAVAESD